VVIYANMLKEFLVPLANLWCWSRLKVTPKENAEVNGSSANPRCSAILKVRPKEMAEVNGSSTNPYHQPARREAECLLRKDVMFVVSELTLGIIDEGKC
jgi:hypothetical protein